MKSYGTISCVKCGRELKLVDKYSLEQDIEFLDIQVCEHCQKNQYKEDWYEEQNNENIFVDNYDKYFGETK